MSALVQIEKPVYGGAFLARAEGKAVFVPLALPGEQVRVRVVEDKRGYATAEIEELVSAAPERISPRCPHFGPCGGCHYQHTDYQTQLQIKKAVLRETLQRGGIDPPAELSVIAGEPWGYRNRIRLAFDEHGNPGYRGRRSHAVVAITECPIAAPLLVRAAFAGAELLRQLPFRPAEMALFSDADETVLQMTLFTAGPAKIRLDEFGALLRQRIPELRGIEIFLERRPDEPGHTLAHWGESSITYHAAGADYRVDHGGFFQVNRRLVDALIEQVTAGCSGRLGWDLFAGVGLFALRLTRNFERIVAVESAPAATEALRSNLAGTNGIAVGSSALNFLRRNRTGAGPDLRSNDKNPSLGTPDLVVVDPPRTGLGPEITALLAEIAPPAIVYVSCDPATLARDLRALVAGGYLIESVALVDLFPQTFHLETVVRLHRP